MELIIIGAAWIGFSVWNYRTAALYAWCEPLEPKASRTRLRVLAVVLAILGPLGYLWIKATEMDRYNGDRFDKYR